MDCFWKQVCCEIPHTTMTNGREQPKQRGHPTSNIYTPIFFQFFLVKKVGLKMSRQRVFGSHGLHARTCTFGWRRRRTCPPISSNFYFIHHAHFRFMVVTCALFSRFLGYRQHFEITSILCPIRQYKSGERCRNFRDHKHPLPYTAVQVRRKVV